MKSDYTKPNQPALYDNVSDEFMSTYKATVDCFVNRDKIDAQIIKSFDNCLAFEKQAPLLTADLKSTTLLRSY